MTGVPSSPGRMGRTVTVHVARSVFHRSAVRSSSYVSPDGPKTTAGPFRPLIV